MSVYGLAFVGVVGAVLPWLAHAAGLSVLAFRPDVGPWRWVGWAVMASAFAGYVGSTVWLTRVGRGAYVEFDAPTRLVTSGPYRWSRNPIALCVLGWTMGLALAFSSAGVFVLFLAISILAHLQVVLLEEPLLRRRFGDAYVDFCARVPRWIPRRPREVTR